jgi:hypothetical protein
VNNFAGILSAIGHNFQPRFIARTAYGFAPGDDTRRGAQDRFGRMRCSRHRAKLRLLFCARDLDSTFLATIRPATNRCPDNLRLHL